MARFISLNTFPGLFFFRSLKEERIVNEAAEKIYVNLCVEKRRIVYRGCLCSVDVVLESDGD